MDVIVTGRHIEITPPIRAYAEEKVSRLPRYYDRVNEIEVVADRHDSHRFAVELIVHVDGSEHFVAKGAGEDLYACIDETTDKMERQLHDHKEKRRNRKHPTPR